MINKYQNKKHYKKLSKGLDLHKSNSLEGYKLFDDINEINSWGRENYSEWMEDVKDKYLKEEFTSTSPFNALQSYGGILFGQINSYLRGTMCTGDEVYVKNLINGIDHLFEIVPPTKENLVTFRIINYNSLHILISKSIDDINKGDIIHEKAYMSSSLYEKYHFKAEKLCYEFALLVIKVPVGTRSIFMPLVRGSVFWEYELLIDRNKSLIIDEILYKGKNRMILLCELV